MSKNIKVKNTSTELFYDLAQRSLEVNWTTMQDMCSDNILYLIDDADFMSQFIRKVIKHISDNFDKFTKIEGNKGKLEQVNLEEVAERLVRFSWTFCK
ncbi:hypothetical protein ACQSFC_16030 [Salmonella enterica]|uniref:hypothetical protein n=1 Tax=Salmonella enterica TaxID=28901 RepID=UPI003D3163B2